MSSVNLGSILIFARCVIHQSLVATLLRVVSEYMRELACRAGERQKKQPTNQPMLSIRMRTKDPSQLNKEERRKNKKSKQGKESKGKIP